ncbi:MAG: tetratricopeptide repeat protein [Bacteroidota bacterium]
MDIDSLLKHFKETEIDSDRVYILDHLYNKFVLSDPEKAREYAEQCLKLSEEINFNKGIAIGKGNLGTSLMMEGDYKKASEYYMDAIRIFEKLRDYPRMAKFYGNFANINFKLNKFNKALEYNNKAIQLKEKSGDNESLSFNYQLNAYIYYMQKNMDKALGQYDLALKVALRHEEKNILPSLYNGYATVYMTNNKFNNAIEMFNKAMVALQDIGGNKKWETGILHNIGRLYYYKKDYKLAIEFLNESLSIAKEIDSKEDIKQAYSSLDQAYYEFGDIQKAYDALSWYSVYKDSVLNENTQNEINSLQEQFESEKKDQQISNLNLENERLASKVITRNIIIGLSLGIFILILLLIILYIKHQKTKELKNRAESEQKALRAQMNPHFIFNSLNSIQRMFMEGNFDLASNYMGDFGQLLRIILENSGKKQISVKDEINTLRLYLEIEKMRTDNFIEYKIDIDPNLDILNNFMPPLIIQPFVENAIWHGILPNDKKGEIKIDLRKKDNRFIICTIIDNGIGINKSLANKKSENHNSKGMKITKERLNGNQSVVAEELKEGGTKITILIPLS